MYLLRIIYVLAISYPILAIELSHVVKSYKEERADRVREYLQGFEIHIVWNAFINPSNPRWLSILHGQWEQLYRSDLTDLSATLNVELIIKEKELGGSESAYNKVLGLIETFTPNAIITRHKWIRDLFEFPGISRVWNVAENTGNSSIDQLILYFHSKCMMHDVSRKAPDSDGRCINDRTMFKYVISPWPRIISLFKDNRQLNRAGLAQSLDGFIWGNFFWVRTSYVSQQLYKPIKHLSSRYYYEHWVGNRTSNMADKVLDGASLCPFLPLADASQMIGRSFHTRAQYNGKSVKRIPCWDKDPFVGSVDPFPWIDAYDRDSVRNT